MAKSEWGLKRICPNCGVRYYDMKKKNPTCPSCGTVFDPEALVRARRGRVVAEDKAQKDIVSPEMVEEIRPTPEAEVDDIIIEDAEDIVDDLDVEEVIDVEEIEDKMED